MSFWIIYTSLACLLANTVCIAFHNSDYEYDYSYYEGYDYGLEQESTVPEEPDVEDVGYITAA